MSTYWLPHKLLRQDPLLCQWFYAGNRKFTEPFFDETIGKCLSHPYNSARFKSVSTLDFLPCAAAQTESIPPSAIIFHVSRCGSTLVSQLLSLMLSNIVLSEVPILDDLLRLPFRNNLVAEEESNRLFLAALRLHGQKRAAEERHLFVKTDSWHILFFDRLRRLFPHTLFVLLYRRPDEVLQSHRQKRGMHAVPGLLEPEIFNFRSHGIKDLSLDDYLARVLESYFAASLAALQKDNNVLLFNYSEGIPHLVEALLHRTGFSPSSEEKEALRKRAAFDAKQPGNSFAAVKNKAVAPLTLPAAFALYNELDKMRMEQLHAG